MTRAWFLCTLAFALMARAETKPSVGVYMDFDSEPAPAAVDAMKHEVGSILGAAGLDVNWRNLSENNGAEVFTGVVVVRFRGKCRVEPWRGEAAEPQFTGEKLALGSSLVSEGHVLPFSWIECDQVRKTVAYEGRSTEVQRQCALGRAMGRVVAHELYHVLACTTKHVGRGLARATQDLKDMATGRLGFHKEDANAIRKGLAGRGVVFGLRGNQ